MIIGVFDSGKGGKIVAKQLHELLPDATIHTATDSKNMPYGGRP